MDSNIFMIFSTFICLNDIKTSLFIDNLFCHKTGQ